MTSDNFSASRHCRENCRERPALLKNIERLKTKNRRRHQIGVTEIRHWYCIRDKLKELPYSAYILTIKFIRPELDPHSA